MDSIFSREVATDKIAYPLFRNRSEVVWRVSRRVVRVDSLEGGQRFHGACLYEGRPALQPDSLPRGCESARNASNDVDALRLGAQRARPSWGPLVGETTTRPSIHFVELP